MGRLPLTRTGGTFSTGVTGRWETGKPPSAAVFAALSLSLLLFTSAATAGVIESEYSGTLHLAPGDLAVTHRMGMDFLELRDGAPAGPVGSPAVPVMQIAVALPPGAEVLAVEITGARFEALPGRFDVAPLTAPERTGVPAPRDPFRKDPAFYDRDADFPGLASELLGTWDLAGQPFATLRLPPVRYNPVKGTLKIARSLSFRVRYRWDPDFPRQTYNFTVTQRRYYERLLRRLAFNPEDVPPLPPYAGGSTATGLEAGQYEYVVVSPNGFENAYQPLVDWRTRMGIPAKTVSLLWIYLNYSGSSNVEKIRNFVKDARVQWGATYFLLGGDTSYLPCAWTTVNGESIPNDTYFSDYDDDWVCELYVGRVPARTVNEVTTCVNKVLAYEKNPPAAFGDTVYFLGFDLDGSTKGEEAKKTTRNLWVPPEAQFFKEYDSEPGGHLQDVIDALNAGKNLVNHIDHCNTYYVGIGSVNHGTGLDTNAAASFSNGTKYINFYTLGCWPGNYADNCWGEVFVRDDQGGITFTGNSRSGWYNPGLYNTLSFKYDRKWWRAIYGEDAWRAGETLAVHKNLYYPSTDLYKYIFTELTLLGDPGLRLWTLDPAGLKVTYDDTVQPGPQTYEVKVSEGTAALEGALVCLWKGEEVYVHGVTNAAGTVTFTINPATPGSMLLTASARNHLPFEGTVDVNSPANPPDIHAVTPDYGLEAGGDPVTVTGVNFTQDMQVAIGGKDCSSVVVLDDTTLTCLSPPGVNGWAAVTVESDAGSSTLTDGFRYFPAGGEPFNAMDVHTESVNPPRDLTLLLSGSPSKTVSVYLSNGPGPVLTSYGVMGLDLPIIHLFSTTLNAQGYAVIPLPVLPGYGPSDFYLHALGVDGAGNPAWSWGGNNPNGSGSVWVHLNY